LTHVVLRLACHVLVGKGLRGEAQNMQPVAPAPVLQQLSVVRQIDFNSVPVLAVGPNFIDSASNIEIAAHFHMAISRLVQKGITKEDSAYVPAALQSLSNFINAGDVGQTAHISVSPASDSDIEQQIHSAMQLSLGIK